MYDMYYKLSNSHQPVLNSLPAGGACPLDRLDVRAVADPLDAPVQTPIAS